MTHEQMLASVEDAVRKAVPEIENADCEYGHGRKCSFANRSRPITLEDVLRTVLWHWKIRLEDREQRMHETMMKWKLGKPVTSQSPELVAFLYSILVI